MGQCATVFNLSKRKVTATLVVFLLLHAPGFVTFVFLVTAQRWLPVDQFGLLVRAIDTDPWVALGKQTVGLAWAYTIVGIISLLMSKTNIEN